MPIKIIALDGLNNAKMCKLMGPLLQTIPGVDYANIDYLSQKLTLQISGRDNARIIESVTEKLKKNMPDVTIRYAQANDAPEDPNKIPMPKVQKGNKPTPGSREERKSNMQEKAQRVREAQKGNTTKLNEVKATDQNGNMAKAITSMMKDEIQHEKSPIEFDHSLGEFDANKLAEMEASRLRDTSPEDMLTVEQMKEERGSDLDLPSAEELRRQEQSEQNKQFAESIVEELEKSKRAERAREKAREESKEETKTSKEEPPIVEEVVEKAPKPPKAKKEKPTKNEEKPSLFAAPSEADDDQEEEEEPFVPIIHHSPVPKPAAEMVDDEDDEDDEDEEYYEDELEEIIDEEYLERQRELEEYENALIGQKTSFIKKIINRIGRETFANTNGLIFTMIAFLIIYLMDLPDIVDYFARLICFSLLSIYALVTDHRKFKFSSWLSTFFVIAPSGVMFFIGSTTQAVLAMAVYNVALIASYLYYTDFNLGVRRSIDIAPKTLIRVLDDLCEELPFNAIKPDDVIIINEGEVIPFDCVVETGESEVDDSFITGNDEPTKVVLGSWIACGSINVGSSLQLRVTKNQEKSVMAVIRRTFMNDSANKLNTVSICKSYVSLLFFIQIFMTLALTAIMVITEQYESIIGFLLIAAVLLAPTGINASIVHSFKGTLGKALKNRITILSCASLEELSKVSSIITGHNEVLNNGEFRVTSVKLIDAKIVNEEKLLEMAAAVESKVDSPISNAIVEYYTTNYETEIDEDSITSCQPFKEGISAIFDLSHGVLVGSYSFMIQNNVLIPENNTEKVCIYVAKQLTYVGSIFLEATPREGHETFTADLRKCGIQNIMLLTGNENPYAEGYGRRYGYNAILAQRTMKDKISTISTLVGAQDKLGNIAYIGTYEEVEEFTKRRCPCICVGKTSFAKTLYSARALIPTSNLSQIVDAIRISKSVRTSCFMSIASSYIIKYVMVAAVYFLNLPFVFASIAVSAAMVLEALIAHSSLGDAKYSDSNINNDYDSDDYEEPKVPSNVSISSTQQSNSTTEPTPNVEDESAS